MGQPDYDWLSSGLVAGGRVQQWELRSAQCLVKGGPCAIVGSGVVGGHIPVSAGNLSIVRSPRHAALSLFNFLV
jgi:hypothetical protein